MTNSRLRPCRVARTLSLTLLIGAIPLAAQEADARPRKNPRYCTQTADLQDKACVAEKRDDYYVARAICANVVDETERADCTEEATTEWRSGLEDCDDVTEAREDLCELVGEQRYEPAFLPQSFDDPMNPSHPNPWFPLPAGGHWTFTDGTETIDIDVLDKTKNVAGVTCLVVRDVVRGDGQPIEDTDDWFAIHANGDVYYCGENTRDYETFAGDDPVEAELVSIDGSFKAGVDGAKAGIVFPGDPQPGRTDRQEWSPSNAEDAATIVSRTYRFGASSELDQLVPRALAELLCSAGDCVVTKEFTPMDPEHIEYKYYARGVGRFLEVNRDAGTAVQLIECNVDSRCSSLPQP
ncbi:MAG: hypothetical protein IPK00_06660 [Deltaproteobacteria bacterium]|nr:hypothetical protein [Deltaproteobacteria bacterium]